MLTYISPETSADVVSSVVAPSPCLLERDKELRTLNAHTVSSSGHSAL